MEGDKSLPHDDLAAQFGDLDVREFYAAEDAGAGPAEPYPDFQDVLAYSGADQKRFQVSRAAAKAKGRITLLGLEHTQKSQEVRGFWAFLERHLDGMVNPESIDKAKDWWERNKDKFSLWLTTLKTIDGKFGSAVMLTFAFLRFLVFLNVLLALLWAYLIIFPFFKHPPKSYSWSLLDAKRSKEPHYLDSTWLFYGGYNYTKGEQIGWYRTDYMYTIVVGLMLLFTLAAVLGRMASHIMGSGDVTAAYSSIYPFSSVIFASWDFHLTTPESSANLRRGIRMRLREMLADCAEDQQEIATWNSAKIYKRNLALFVLFPGLMTCTVTTVVLLVSKQAAIDSAFGFMKGMAQPLLLAIVNISSPLLTRMLVDMEAWKPSTADQVLLVKLYLVRMLNLGTLFYRLYAVLEEGRSAQEGSKMHACPHGSCNEGLLCCLEKDAYDGVWPSCRPSRIGYCVADCADNLIAKLLLELIASSTIIDNITELCWGIFMVYYHKTRGQLALEELPIRVVYIQGIIWVASLFSPIACLLGAVSHCITFLCMKAYLTQQWCLWTVERRGLQLRHYNELPREGTNSGLGHSRVADKPDDSRRHNSYVDFRCRPHESQDLSDTAVSVGNSQGPGKPAERVSSKDCNSPITDTDIPCVASRTSRNFYLINYF